MKLNLPTLRQKDHDGRGVLRGEQEIEPVLTLEDLVAAVQASVRESLVEANIVVAQKVVVNVVIASNIRGTTVDIGTEQNR